jgi:hypothetical protein
LRERRHLTTPRFDPQRFGSLCGKPQLAAIDIERLLSLMEVLTENMGKIVEVLEQIDERLKGLETMNDA